MAGMAASPTVAPDGTPRLTGGEPVGAPFHLERLLRDYDLARVCRWLPLAALAPRLVIVLGTNDLPTDPGPLIANHILALQRRAEAVAPCLRVYVATILPRFDAVMAREAQRVLANGVLRSVVPRDRLIELDTGFTRDDFGADGVHLGWRGHVRLERAAFRVLFPALLDGSGPAPDAASWKCRAAIERGERKVGSAVFRDAVRCQARRGRAATNRVDGLAAECVGNPGNAGNEASARIARACIGLTGMDVGTCDPLPGCVVATAETAGRLMARAMFR
jgi:hypothetical protein